MATLSVNTQAILLITAPLIGGKQDDNGLSLLSPGAYRRLARWLHTRNLSPSDLLGHEADILTHECEAQLNLPPLKPLLERGFQLSQAVEHWNQRSIWVISRADSNYPRRFKERLGEAAPPVLYGCGNPDLLGKGGLAVVGSRNVSDELLQYTANMARLCAEAGHAVISGGARGVDQAAMRGAGEAEGQVVGVLADSLERAVINREHRQPLMSGSLILCSPYDPQAGFNAGHAMQRNKLIYALADAALVVNADYQKGGTWNGAVEQIETYRHIPVFVRGSNDNNKALNALMQKGAYNWAYPNSPEAFAVALKMKPKVKAEPTSMGLFETSTNPTTNGSTSKGHAKSKMSSGAEASVVLWKLIEQLIMSLTFPVTESEIADRFDVTKPQARKWLLKLCKEGQLVRRTKPVRYEPSTVS